MFVNWMIISYGYSQNLGLYQPLLWGELSSISVTGYSGSSPMLLWNLWLNTWTVNDPILKFVETYLSRICHLFYFDKLLSIYMLISNTTVELLHQNDFDWKVALDGAGSFLSFGSVLDRKGDKGMNESKVEEEMKKREVDVNNRWEKVRQWDRKRERNRGQSESKDI